MALRYICFVKVLLKEQIFTILFLLICIDDCSWQVSWINSGVLSCRFSQCMLNLEKILERNLVELENIIIWKLLITEKYVKIRLKNRGSPCYYLSSRGQKIKNIIKIKQKRLCPFIFLVSFFMAFLAQKLIYTITI